MSAGNIISGIGALVVVGFIICGVIAAATILDNEKEEVIVDCYDKESNVINEVTCTETKYHCNKFQRFLLDSCLEEIK